MFWSFHPQTFRDSCRTVDASWFIPISHWPEHKVFLPRSDTLTVVSPPIFAAEQSWHGFISFFFYFCSCALVSPSLSRSVCVCVCVCVCRCEGGRERVSVCVSTLAIRSIEEQRENYWQCENLLKFLFYLIIIVNWSKHWMLQRQNFDS